MWLAPQQVARLGILPALVPLIATGLTVGAQVYQQEKAEKAQKKELRRQQAAEAEARRLAEEEAARRAELATRASFAAQLPPWALPATALAVGTGIFLLMVSRQ